MRYSPVSFRQRCAYQPVTHASFLIRRLLLLLSYLRGLRTIRSGVRSRTFRPCALFALVVLASFCMRWFNAIILWILLQTHETDPISGSSMQQRRLYGQCSYYLCILSLNIDQAQRTAPQDLSARWLRHRLSRTVHCRATHLPHGQIKGGERKDFDARTQSARMWGLPSLSFVLRKHWDAAARSSAGAVFSRFRFQEQRTGRRRRKRFWLRSGTLQYTLNSGTNSPLAPRIAIRVDFVARHQRAP